jgi:hypothetical protein
MVELAENRIGNNLSVPLNQAALSVIELKSKM